MTIRRGEDWGRAIPPPDDLVWFDDDAKAASGFSSGLRRIGLRGGDMARTLGADGGRSDPVSFEIDVMKVTWADGAETHALAHVTVRDRRWSWWRGSVVAVMNAQYRGKWDVAPRGHPNDGRLEVLEVDSSMSWRQRWLAVRRLPTGAHLPHPSIRTRSLPSVTVDVPAGAYVEVDGRTSMPATRSSAASLTVECLADALEVWIGDAGRRPGVR